MRNTFRLRFVAVLVACAPGLCIAQDAALPSSTLGVDSVEESRDYAYADPDGLTLEPGEFAWLPGSDDHGSAPVTLLVSLRDQRGYLYREGRRIAVTTLSTGRPGYDTPTGVFPIMGKKRTHYSNRYDNAPMPWMQRLTRWGHALHAGEVRPRPASHGCVRLPSEFAKQLFALTRTGDLVVISQDVSARSLAIALAISDADASTAHLVGITEPLPRITLIPNDRQRTSNGPSVVATSDATGF